ncbi:MAG TPA: FecR family protein, partial [Candidatus Ozemobacteraceae bacterium]|nr:FecR family protein [Candidatus Ozemobacteraceae bacterium]
TLVAPVDIIPRLSPHLQNQPSPARPHVWPLVLVFLGIIGIVWWLTVHTASDKSGAETGKGPATVSPGPEPRPLVPVKKSEPVQAPLGVIAWRFGDEEASTTPLMPDCRIEVPATGYAELRLAGEERIAALPDTLFQAETNGVTLVRGGIWCDIPPRRDLPPFRVHTPEGDVIVIGTKFGVEVASGSVTVDLFKGRIAFRPAFGTSDILEAGSSAVISSGTVSVSEIPTIREAFWRRWIDIPVSRRPPMIFQNGRNLKPSDVAVSASSAETILPKEELATSPKSGLPQRVLGNHRIGR